MDAETITIPRRCNGPPGSANGGYACGLVADVVGIPVEVSLRVPPPLERPLRVVRDGERLEVRDGETLVAEGARTEVDLEPPVRPSLEAAAGASRRGAGPWARDHPFPTCVTCGPEREPGDGLRIFPGALDGRGEFAADWTPHPTLAGPDGAVPAPWVWAALDCPSSAPVLMAEREGPCVLARLGARLFDPVEAGSPHVVVSWPLESDGRKHHTASALLKPSGELRGVARALWIELRPSS